MKKFIFLFLIIAGSCSKDDTVKIITDPLKGSWGVISFIDNNSVITDQFNGYMFRCKSNGELLITGNGQTYYCTWNWNNDDFSSCHFEIRGCDEQSVLWECNDDWDITGEDEQYCYFSSHNSQHNRTMTWTRLSY